jgi:carboxymethylenebutenolidase
MSAAVALSTAVVAGWFKSDARAQGGYTMNKQAMTDLFQKHVDAEMAGDLETTMATMNDKPHLNHVPTMAGGVGRDGVKAFYRDHLVGKFFPPDVKMTPVSRTVGDTQVVEELVISFTHTTAIDWLLPGVAPTGKPVEMAVAVIVGFKDDKISHEHIYWDQAGVLVQVGLLDPKGLPVSGAESARKVLDPSLPPRRM